jgi:hypothetical protein
MIGFWTESICKSITTHCNRQQSWPVMEYSMQLDPDSWWKSTHFASKADNGNLPHSLNSGVDWCWSWMLNAGNIPSPGLYIFVMISVGVRWYPSIQRMVSWNIEPRAGHQFHFWNTASYKLVTCNNWFEETYSPQSANTLIEWWRKDIVDVAKDRVRLFTV